MGREREGGGEREVRAWSIINACCYYFPKISMKFKCSNTIKDELFLILLIITNWYIVLKNREIST